MTLTLNTWIVSPKLIANGRGAWEGTLADLISSEVDAWEGVALTMIEEGRLTREEWEDDDFDLADYVERMTVEDVRGLADDPNARIGGSLHKRMDPARFKQTRKTIGLTGDELAYRLGVRSDTLRRWESGRDPIPYAVPGELLEVASGRLLDLEELISGLEREV